MKIIRIISIIILILIIATGAYSRRRRGVDYFLKPQLGLWFGPITPVYTTRKYVDTNLGGGIFFRYNSPIKSLKYGIDGSYQYFESKGVNTLSLWPVYGSLIYRAPVIKQFPLKFQFKVGAGTSYVKIRPDRDHQWDPVGMLGFEGSFPAGKILNIGLRVDYLLIYEEHIDGASRNGHILNTGITVYFNI
ncbi:MAG: hypothetical protein SVZ03_10630 [Spirochaetota bacterium]|nr:hypothetical protein [Spirochaetota bacterium]